MTGSENMVKFNWKLDIVPLICITAAFILAAVAWPQAPDAIPVHWGVDGQADSYTGKFYGLLGIPLLSLGLYVLFYVMPLLDPRRENYRKFWSRYLFIRNILILVMTGISLIVFLWAIGIGIDTGIAVFILVGLLLIFLGNYLGKLRPTWFVGIRTPWTLSSEESWNKTHRLGGKLFVVIGFLMIAAGIVREQWLNYAAIYSVPSFIVILYAYSYLVWRKDPNAAPAGTRIAYRNSSGDE